MATYPPFAQLIADMKTETAGFKLVEKGSSKFMRALSWLMFFSKGFMKDYTTTIGKTVYMPQSIIGTYTGYEVLRHERIHILDAKKWCLLMPLSYIFLLPSVVTMRAYWEFRGYSESLKVAWETAGKPRNPDGSPWMNPSNVEWAIRQFTGPDYLWMFPFPKTLRRAFAEASKSWV